MHDTARTELSAPIFPAFSPLPFLGSLLTCSKPTYLLPDPLFQSQNYGKTFR
ncbi:hypothetical protein CORC01_05779 [Colletotrichum orchidophilum]|uniref:Uncharacterized protein n=1 Tax=Colletotrichum orchidophilum TaxID=1209926 RepID=A0A1G4BBY0_9PEZI|nr:uncharacterized protein CORC01_05779 [Colletotrichum orchidophilum]OHE98883.1 hypothetical protein CORC01_05779 [Colletotrichum orchidophilum]